MIATLATLAFLAAAWLAVVTFARTLEENWTTIAAALRGQSPHAEPQPVIIAWTRRQPASVRSVRSKPELRAAA